MTIKLASSTRNDDTYPRGLLMTKPATDTAILSEWVRTEFHLPQSVVALCSQYFLRVWTGSYVMESIQNGILYGRADNWIAHFQSTPEIVKNSQRVACSFREYAGKKYVVIKVWKGAEE